MRKWALLLALTLCLALVFPTGLAESAAYVPSQPTADAFARAFDAGKIITGEISLDLNVNPALLADSEEEAAQMETAMLVLKQASLTLGAGKIENGLRLLLGATLYNEDATASVDVAAQADVTLEGICVESELIAGKRVSATWETLLALAGMPQDQIAVFTALKGMDWAAVLDEVIAQIPAYVQYAAQIAAPYGEIVSGFIATLPMSIEEDLAVEDYPPTALEIGVTFTQQDLGTLLGQLLDQLEQDTVLLPAIEQALAASGEEMTGAQLIAQLRERAASMTDTDTPITLYLGLNEESVPLYLEAYIEDEPSGESLYGGLFCYESAPASGVFEFIIGMFDAEQNAVISLYAGGTAVGDPADPYTTDIAGELYVIEGDAVLADMQLATSVKPAATEAGLPAYATQAGFSMYVYDGEAEVQAVFSQDSQNVMTAAGGETTSVSGTMDIYVDDVASTISTSGGMLIEPTADGGLTGYYTISESAPGIGIDSYTLDIRFGTQDYDPAASAALTPLTLETITTQEMDALSAEVQNALSVKLVQAMGMLPQEVLLQLMSSGDATTAQ